MKRLNLKNEIISFEIAKLAKEKGFANGTRSSYCHYLGSYVYDGDPEHRESYKKDDIRLDHDFYMVNNSEEIDLSNEHYSIYEAPSQSLLQRWLREAHDISIIIPYACSYTICFNLINKEGLCEYPNENHFNTYEEALEAGLLAALKLI